VYVRTAPPSNHLAKNLPGADGVRQATVAAKVNAVPGTGG